MAKCYVPTVWRQRVIPWPRSYDPYVAAVFGAALMFLAEGAYRLVAGWRYRKGYDDACRAIYAAYPEIGWPPRSKRPPDPPKMPPPHDEWLNRT